MSTKKPDSTKIEFLEVKDEAMISKFLGTLQNMRIPITFWIKDQPIRFETKAKEYLQFLKRLTFEFPTDIKMEDFQKALSAQGSPQLLASFQLQTVYFFLKTDFVSFQAEQNVIQVSIPKTIFKLQRRTSLRISFKRKEAPKLTMFDPGKQYNMVTANPSDLVDFRVLDVSTTGLAFAAPIEFKDHILKGQKLYLLAFKIRGKEIHATAKVMHCREAMNDLAQPVIKVGVLFLDLKGDYERWIDLYVLDESREMFELIFQ